MSPIKPLLLINGLDTIIVYWASCNDPHQIIQVFDKFDPVNQPIVGGAKLTFSRTNNFELTKTPFRRPHRYEFTDR